MHSDVSPDSAGSALFGWLLVMLGQDVGFPVPEGGAGVLATALRRRAESLGVQVRCGVPVTAVHVSCGRARAVLLADGTTVRARHAVLADVPAPALYEDLVDPRHLPPRFRRRRAPVRLGRRDPQGQLGARRAHPVGGAGRPRRRHGAPRCRRRRARRRGRRPLGGPDAAPPVHAARPDDDGRPHPLPGGHRVGLGLHPPAARSCPPTTPRSTCRCSGWRTRSSRWPPGSARRCAPGRCSAPATSRPPTPASAAAPSTPAPPPCTSSSCCGRPAGWAGPRRRCPGSTSPGRPPTPAAGCTGRAAGTPPSRRCGTAGPLGLVRRAVVRTAWSRVLRDPG